MLGLGSSAWTLNTSRCRCCCWGGGWPPRSVLVPKRGRSPRWVLVATAGQVWRIVWHGWGEAGGGGGCCC